MNWRLAVPLTAAGGLLSAALFLSTATAESGLPPNVTVAPSVRPFDPRTDRLATDSTAHLNVAGRPGVVLPNLCEQRARSGVAGSRGRSVADLRLPHSAQGQKQPLWNESRGDSNDVGVARREGQHQSGESGRPLNSPAR
jgi:hypothetical protein